MGRTYAGILGALAMSVTLVRGVAAGGGTEETLVHALAGMIVFSLLGLVIGVVGDWMIADAVYAEVQREVAEQETRKNNRSDNNTTR